MSFRAPKPPKRKGVSDSVLQPSSSLTATSTSLSTSCSASPSKAPAARHLVPPSMIPRSRRPRNSRDLYLPGPEQILTLPGQSYSQMPSSSHVRSTNASSTHVPQNVGRHTGAHDLSAGPDNNPYRSPGAFDIINDIFVADAPESEEFQREKQRRKKEKQWKKWTQEIIPSLLRPHLRLLRKSASLRSMPQHTDYHCKCGGTSSRRLKVVCVSFEREFYILYGISAPVCWIQDMFAYNFHQNSKQLKSLHAVVVQLRCSCCLVVFFLVPQQLLLSLSISRCWSSFETSLFECHQIQLHGATHWKPFWGKGLIS
jgi:hypothetical protein